MITRARLSQERSRQRRDDLLDAAIELFADGGPRGITHRAVAAKAGLPPATTTYYFASIDELIQEALSRHIERWLHDLQALTATPVDADISLDDASGLITAIFAVRSPNVVGLHLSIYLAAARDHELRRRAAEALDALEILATKTLQNVGIVGADDLARSLVALIAGSAVGRLSERNSNEDEAAMLYRSIRGLVVATLLSEDEIMTTLKRLEQRTSERSAECRSGTS